VFPFQVIINGLVTGLLYSLVALAFSLIYSGTRVFHIAHGAMCLSLAFSSFLKTEGSR